MAGPPDRTLAAAIVERRVRELGEWFHNLRVAGVQTAPHHFLGDYPAVKWRTFAHTLPADLRGRSVLDVGCNAGFYSQEMKRRGADRVVAIDSDDRYLAQARYAADVAGLEIEFHRMSVYEIPALGERFDIVLFLGVLYHLRYPLLALDLLHEHAVGDLLVFQTMVRGPEPAMKAAADYGFGDHSPFDEYRYPVLFFVEESYAGDPTNWWIPTGACAEAMLRSAGFEIQSRPESEVFVCRRTDRDPALPREAAPWSKR